MVKHCASCGAESLEHTDGWCGFCGAALSGDRGTWELEAPSLKPSEKEAAEPTDPSSTERHGRRKRRVSLWLTAGLLVLAAIGAGVYFLVAALGGGQGEEMGLFPVAIDGKSGFIGNTGEMVIQLSSPYMASEFSEGLAAQGVEDASGRVGFGYLDETGAWAIQPRFDMAFDFHDGLARVTEGDQQGYIDKTGAMVIQLRESSEAYDLSQGLALVGFPDGDRTVFGYIDKTGATAITPQFEYAGGFSEGLAFVQVRVDGGAGMFGYIDKTGAFVITPRFEYAGDFSEGLAAAMVTEDGVQKWGYIDKTGSWEIQPQFGEVGNFSEDLAWVEVGRPGYTEYGYIDKTGSFVIEPRFGQAQDFSEGLAAAAANVTGGGSPLSSTVSFVQKWGYIDKAGEWAIQPRFLSGGDFSKGLAMVEFGGAASVPSPIYVGAHWTFGYVDRSGTVVWRGDRPPPAIRW